MRGTSHGPSAGRLGDRYGLTVRLVRVSVGRWRRGLILLMTGDDPGTMGRTRGRICVFEGSASAQPSSRSAPVAVTSPGRHRRVTAETEEVVTGSPLSGITRGIILHDTVAMASTAGGVVGL